MLGRVYRFALFLFARWWGRLSGRHGREVLMAGVARLAAGADAAAIVPTAQAYISDISTSAECSRRFVLLGSASFLGPSHFTNEPEGK
jgi:MFS transporter, DHA1 family, multidrug resistance protein